MAKSSKQPNIIFVFSDQQRFDTMGCYGQELNVTPNLDNMAKKGILFENNFTCQPVCGPARSCLQTGLYAEETGCFRNAIALPFSDENLANYFSNGGYEVGYIGKWHLASTQFPRKDKRSSNNANYVTKPIPSERRGGYKDFWVAADCLEHTSHGYEGHMFDADGKKVEFSGYRVDGVTDVVMQFLESRSLEKPFFLFLSYLEPHHQNDHRHYEGPHGSKEKFKDFKVPGDLVGTGGNWKEEYPDYLGCCNSIDYNVQRILDKLHDLNIDDKTVIIYTSDHGSHFKTRNSEYKRSCHEASIHTPLIIKGPGFEGGKRRNEIISLIDLPPTLLDIAGIPIPEQFRGKSIKSLVDGKIEKEEWSQEAFIQISETQVGRAIRTKKWKYSVRAPNKIGVYHSKSNKYIEDFLYDLENDIHERNNLVKDPKYADIRKELSERLKKRMIAANEKEPKIYPWMTKWRRFFIR